MTVAEKIERAIALSLQGDWQAAHVLIDDLESPIACWLHASLHREEGDLGNARYWYERAGKPVSDSPFDEERGRIAEAFRRVETATKAFSQPSRQ